MNIKLTNINPDDLILAIRAAKSFASEGKPIGIRHGTVYSYHRPTHADWMNDKPEAVFYVYQTKTMIVVRYSRQLIEIERGDAS